MFIIESSHLPLLFLNSTEMMATFSLAKEVRHPAVRVNHYLPSNIFSADDHLPNVSAVNTNASFGNAKQ
jgi:hypothetical protein